LAWQKKAQEKRQICIEGIQDLKRLCREKGTQKSDGPRLDSGVGGFQKTGERWLTHPDIPKGATLANEKVCALSLRTFNSIGGDWADNPFQISKSPSRSPVNRSSQWTFL
jgi:hypothetical protein